MSFELERDEVGALVLRDTSDSRLSPLKIDFLEPKNLYRLKHGLGRSQPLPRALGLKSGVIVNVFDATAGLGTDAFFMAAMGAHVHGVERNELVFALLDDAYERLRASEEPELVAIAERLSFEQGDSAALLAQASPDVVYLDPMYPEEGRNESALPKKAMQIFRRMIGDDFDADALFRVARERARARVVVKRPLKAPALAGEKPTHIFSGKTARFDMYAQSNPQTDTAGTI